MKRYTLKFVSGPNEGKFVGNNPTLGTRISVSKGNPKLWSSLSGAKDYLYVIGVRYGKATVASQLKAIPLWLVGEDQLPFTVHIYEYERGWGSRHEGTHGFPTAEEADAFCVDYNKDNTDEVVPDYYWAAKRIN